MIRRFDPVDARGDRQRSSYLEGQLGILANDAGRGVRSASTELGCASVGENSTAPHIQRFDLAFQALRKPSIIGVEKRQQLAQCESGSVVSSGGCSRGSPSARLEGDCRNGVRLRP